MTNSLSSTLICKKITKYDLNFSHNVGVLHFLSVMWPWILHFDLFYIKLRSRSTLSEF